VCVCVFHFGFYSSSRSVAAPPEPGTIRAQGDFHLSGLRFGAVRCCGDARDECIWTDTDEPLWFPVVMRVTHCAANHVFPPG
jgi:hypothetical protein